MMGAFRRLWDSARIFVRLSSSAWGIEFRVSSPLKLPAGRRPTAKVKRTNRQNTSAAGNDPAVKELRQKLQQHPSLIAEWEAAGEKVTDELLWRWVKAKGSVADAEACLIEHAQWRIALGPITEDDIRGELEAQKVFQQGCDVHGRPIIIVLAARHVIKRRNLDETKRLITFTLETALGAADFQTNPMGQILCLFDLSGLGLGNLDSKALQAVFAVLQQQFPESLSELWFLNAPFIFWGLWRVVSPFIQPATRDKIQFLSGTHKAELLKETIPKQALPQCYGGSAELVSVEQAAKLNAHRTFTRSLKESRSSALQDGPNRLMAIRRFTVRASVGTWGFVRDHNPWWAAKLFGRGAKRLAARRPGRQQDGNAATLKERVHSAWLNRPPLPRPSYRYQPREAGDASHVAILDVASFYIILVSLLALAVLMYQQWLLSFGLPAAFWMNRR